MQKKKYRPGRLVYRHPQCTFYHQATNGWVGVGIRLVSVGCQTSAVMKPRSSFCGCHVTLLEFTFRALITVESAVYATHYFILTTRTWAW